MAKTYYTVLTSYGAQLFAQCIAQKKSVPFRTFAVGDGNGKAVQPDSTRTTLVREKWRANISAISKDPRNNKQVIFELTIPENVGGFYVREMGLFDDQNRLVAYANCPESFKPQIAEGSGKVQVLRMVLLVSSSDAVTVTVDDSVIFVTRSQLTPKTITASTKNGFDETGHTHEIDKASLTTAGLVQLTNDTGLDSEALALTAKGGKALSQQIAKNKLDADSKFIQNSKKSSAVDSNSDDTVATSKAVKLAYDLAMSRQSPATTLAGYNIADGVGTIKHDDYKLNNNNIKLGWRTAAPFGVGIVVDGTNQGVIVTRSALSKSVTHDDNTIPASVAGVKIAFDASTNANDNANKRVLYAYGNRYARVDTTDNAMAGLTVFRKGNSGTWESSIDALVDKRWRFYTQDGPIVFVPNHSGTLIIDADVDINSTANKLVKRDGSADVNGRLFRATYPNQNTMSGAIAFRVNNTGDNYTRYCDNPAAVRTWLGVDVIYQKIGNFEVRKYPDGTMIQTHVYEINDLTNWAERSFSWAVAFVETPLIFEKITTSTATDTIASANILSKSNATSVSYVFYERHAINQGKCRVQFLAIGRWK